MNCPCENCICLPVCRYKDAYDLFGECSLLREFIPEHNLEFKKRIQYLQEILKPTHWIFKNEKGWYFKNEKGGWRFIQKNIKTERG